MTYLAAILVFGAVFLLVLALKASDTRVRSRLDSLRGTSGGGGARQPSEDEEQLTASQRLVAPIGDALVRVARRLMPTPLLDRIQARLIVAGEPMSVNSFLVLQLLVPAGFLLAPLLLIFGTGMSITLMKLFLIGGLLLAGLLLPNMWLGQRVGQRQHLIIKSLPDAFDLITTCVEAGLGLDAALARVAEKVEGPFADELRRMLRDVSLGKMRREALRELGVRTGVPDLVSFVNAVIQAEQMGSSVGQVLRVQADQLRVRRRQRAEEQAYKAPVKMIFPLVLCIFPTLFIVILGPAVITIMRDFPGGG